MQRILPFAAPSFVRAAAQPGPLVSRTGSAGPTAIRTLLFTFLSRLLLLWPKFHLSSWEELRLHYLSFRMSCGGQVIVPPVWWEDRAEYKHSFLFITSLTSSLVIDVCIRSIRAKINLPPHCSPDRFDLLNDFLTISTEIHTSRAAAVAARPVQPAEPVQGCMYCSKPRPVRHNQKIFSLAASRHQREIVELLLLTQHCQHQRYFVNK